MWEYKLPDPPTPFQDGGCSSLIEKLSVSRTASSHSSMSADSLQDSRSSTGKDSPRPPLDTVTLDSGTELLGESATDDSMVVGGGDDEGRSREVMKMPSDPQVSL